MYKQPQDVEINELMIISRDFRDIHSFVADLINNVIKWKHFPCSWWRHQMETFSRYWPFVQGIHRSPVNSPHKNQWYFFDIFFDLHMNKRLSNRSWGWWFETLSHQFWRPCNVLALCAGNSPVTGEFPVQMPVTRGFGVFFDLRMDKRLSKQSWGWWFETPSRSIWRHCNDTFFNSFIYQNQLITIFSNILS